MTSQKVEYDNRLFSKFKTRDITKPINVALSQNWRVRHDRILIKCSTEGIIGNISKTPLKYKGVVVRVNSAYIRNIKNKL